HLKRAVGEGAGAAGNGDPLAQLGPRLGAVPSAGDLRRLLGQAGPVDPAGLEAGRAEICLVVPDRIEPRLLGLHAAGRRGEVVGHRCPPRSGPAYPTRPRSLTASRSESSEAWSTRWARA